LLAEKNSFKFDPGVYTRRELDVFRGTQAARECVQRRFLT